MLLNSFCQSDFPPLERYIDILVILAGYCLLSVIILLSRGTNNKVWWILSVLWKSICKKQILNDSNQIFDMKTKLWDRNILCAYWLYQAAWILNIQFVYKAFAINCRFRIVQQICLITGKLKFHSLRRDNSYTRKEAIIVSFLWTVHLKLLGELNK